MRYSYRFTLLLPPLCLAGPTCGSPSSSYAHMDGSQICAAARRCCESLKGPGGFTQCQSADEALGHEPSQAACDVACRNLLQELGPLCPADVDTSLTCGP